MIVRSEKIFDITSSKGFAPTQPYINDACWDLYVPKLEAQDVPDGASLSMYVDSRMHLVISPFKTIKIPTFVRVNLDLVSKSCDVPRSAALILPRSSISARGILIHTGVIDEGYKGVLHIVLTNLNSSCIDLPIGSRIAQLMLLPMHSIDNMLSLLPTSSSPRGDQGFGSSGTN